MNGKFEQERQAAQPKAEALEAVLQELGIVHNAIPWQHSGIFASVTSGAIHLGELFDLREKDIDTVLDEVRHTWSRALARGALEIEQGNGHFIHTSSIISYGSRTGWLKFTSIMTRRDMHSSASGSSLIARHRSAGSGIIVSIRTRRTDDAICLVVNTTGMSEKSPTMATVSTSAQAIRPKTRMQST